ncbi:MAG: hypothetical protein FJ218_01795 [Ignavibacteria bacterium]|nr:hypothetical protein [Ignavibacteria bacterium]
MNAIRLQTTLEKDGVVILSDLPYKKGERVEMILLFEKPKNKQRLTAKKLLHSKLVGLWRNRKDIHDSVAFARELREQSQKRVRA